MGFGEMCGVQHAQSYSWVDAQKSWQPRRRGCMAFGHCHVCLPAGVGGGDRGGRYGTGTDAATALTTTPPLPASQLLSSPFRAGCWCWPSLHWRRTISHVDDVHPNQKTTRVHYIPFQIWCIINSVFSAGTGKIYIWCIINSVFYRKKARQGSPRAQE
jgi:hypothetical protein